MNWVSVYWLMRKREKQYDLEQKAYLLRSAVLYNRLGAIHINPHVQRNFRPSMALFNTIGSFELQKFFGLRQLLLALIAWMSYIVCLGFYRIYFSPLAKFPGKKLAALTTWYQGYYDIWLRGQYVWKIKEMHAQYGPIIRINPHEIHIDDPEYIDEVFAGSSKKRDKYKWLNRLTLTSSVVSTVPHELHRKRRAALSMFFSKASIRRLEPMIQEVVAQVLNRMEICGKSGEVMPMNTVYKALTCDIITRYSFGKSTNFVTREDYNVTCFDTTKMMFECIHWMYHIGWLGSLMESLPIEIPTKLMPGLGSIFKLELGWKSQIEAIKRSKGSVTGQDNIFYGLVHSNLPESEKATSRLQQEAMTVIQAGQDSTAHTLSALTYHLLANPDKLSKLKKELADAIPDPTDTPTCQKVENLPYLSAAIQEVLRLHPGITIRSPRVSPDDALHYDDGSNPTWVIPAGTPISMSASLIQTNPQIFPNPHEFRPERWLENPRLDRYLLTFSKGTRMCLGMNLAYQEIYLVTAAVFRKYDLYDTDTGMMKQQGPTLALYDTTRARDVEMMSDMGIPFPALGSKGVRLLIRS